LVRVRVRVKVRVRVRVKVRVRCGMGLGLVLLGNLRLGRAWGSLSLTLSLPMAILLGDLGLGHAIVGARVDLVEVTVHPVAHLVRDRVRARAWARVPYPSPCP